MRKHKFVLMNEAGADGGAAGGGADGGTVMDMGADGAAGNPWDFVPEKFRVMGEDGAFDAIGSLRKIVDPYTHLEKRMGAGDVPPKEAKEYKLNVPDELKDKIDLEKLAGDEKFQGFVDRMHKVGLSQAQFDATASELFSTAVDIAEAMSAGSAPMTKEQAIAALQADPEFDTPDKLTAGVRASFRGLVGAVGQEAAKNLVGKYGNDPDFVKAWAAIGREMREDVPPNTSGGGQAVDEQAINTLMLSEAYQNPRHPEHQQTSKKVNDFFRRKYGDRTIA